MRNKHLLFAMITAFCLQAIATNFSQAQTTTTRQLALQVTNLKNSGISFKPVTLLNLNAARSAEMPKAIKGAVPVTLDLNALSAMRANNDDAIAFSFPYDGKNITLELYRVNIFTDDFTVVTDKSNGEAVPYTPGIYYRGIVKGDENSVAALSFFDGEMMGVVSANEYQNINIGKSGKPGAKANDYIIYSDESLPNLQNFSCATPENPDYIAQMKEYATNGATLRTDNCVRIYWEVDNNIYSSSGSSTTNATNWMTAVHNNVATLYSNDDINISLSQVFVWTTSDPYNGTSSSSQLSKFKTTRPTFNGDLGQLVGIDPGGLGGVASTIDGMCSSSNKYCYSDVDYFYNTVPTYSWTIMVCTHELGHLMGSAHTQNCGWPGGAIDNCYSTEGGCSPGPAPVGGGTIMSYCHLTSYGINFNKGFGPLPAAAIQGAVDGEACLSSCVGTCSTPTGLSASSVTSSSATLNWSSASGANSYNIQYRPTGTSTWTTTTATTNSKAVSGLNTSTQYEFQVQSVCTSTSSAYSASANFTTQTPSCVDIYEPNNTKNTAVAIPLNTSLNALINVPGDEDFFSFSNTASQPNIKVTVTTLPANYDLQLFEPNGAKIAASKKGNTTNEEIILNNWVVGTYKIKVFGANDGAFNATQCYTLLANISSTPFRFAEEETEAAAVATVNIYPNPTTGGLTVNYTTNSDAAVEFYVTDVTGKIMVMESNEAFKGINTYNFDLNRLNNGIYFLQIKNGKEITHTKFVIGR